MNKIYSISYWLFLIAFLLSSCNTNNVVEPPVDTTYTVINSFALRNGEPWEMNCTATRFDSSPVIDSNFLKIRLQAYRNAIDTRDGLGLSLYSIRIGDTLSLVYARTLYVTTKFTDAISDIYLLDTNAVNYVIIDAMDNNTISGRFQASFDVLNLDTLAGMADPSEPARVEFTEGRFEGKLFIR